MEALQPSAEKANHESADGQHLALHDSASRGKSHSLQLLSPLALVVQVANTPKKKLGISSFNSATQRVSTTVPRSANMKPITTGEPPTRYEVRSGQPPSFMA